MLQVNFLPWRERQRMQRYHFWKRLFSFMLCMVVAIAGIVNGGLQADIKRSEKQLALLASNQVLLSRQQEKIETTLRHIKENEQRTLLGRQQFMHSLRYLQLLETIARWIPPDVWLTAVEERTGNITLLGEGGSYPAILAFSQGLGKNVDLQHIKLTEIRYQPTQKFRFTLQAQFVGQDFTE